MPQPKHYFARMYGLTNHRMMGRNPTQRPAIMHILNPTTNLTVCTGVDAVEKLAGALINWDRVRVCRRCEHYTNNNIWKVV